MCCTETKALAKKRIKQKNEKAFETTEVFQETHRDSNLAGKTFSNFLKIPWNEKGSKFPGKIRGKSNSSSKLARKQKETKQKSITKGGGGGYVNATLEMAGRDRWAVQLRKTSALPWPLQPLPSLPLPTPLPPSSSQQPPPRKPLMYSFAYPSCPTVPSPPSSPPPLTGTIVRQHPPPGPHSAFSFHTLLSPS